MFGGGFRSLINFSVVASWAFFFLTVLGLIILRVKEPQLPRPYKTWLTTPLLFASVALFLLCMPIIAAPLGSPGRAGLCVSRNPCILCDSREGSGTQCCRVLFGLLQPGYKDDHPRKRDGKR
ncbi:hypothetical protein DL96DRAFT_1703314 [Flagelloscypha sp. PMI_526]|nr:hypothetical protein DL96DRAFT_1703314 [Flagelloscypha sp. PMI_526]